MFHRREIRNEVVCRLFDDLAGIQGTMLALIVLFQMLDAPQAALTLTLVSATDVGVLGDIVVEIIFVGQFEALDGTGLDEFL